jgi:hypothetical protein
MNRRTLIAALLICLLLFSGWAAYQLLGPATPIQVDNAFRQWLWTERRFDLLLQMVLIFAGALSIAAILQVKEEDDD